MPGHRIFSLQNSNYTGVNLPQSHEKGRLQFSSEITKKSAAIAFHSFPLVWGSKSQIELSATIGL